MRQPESDCAILTHTISRFVAMPSGGLKVKAKRVATSTDFLPTSELNQLTLNKPVKTRKPSHPHRPASIVMKRSVIKDGWATKKHYPIGESHQTVDANGDPIPQSSKEDWEYYTLASTVSLKFENPLAIDWTTAPAEKAKATGSVSQGPFQAAANATPSNSKESPAVTSMPKSPPQANATSATLQNPLVVTLAALTSQLPKLKLISAVSKPSISRARSAAASRIDSIQYSRIVITAVSKVPSPKIKAVQTDAGSPNIKIMTITGINPVRVHPHVTAQTNTVVQATDAVNPVHGHVKVVDTTASDKQRGFRIRTKVYYGDLKFDNLTIQNPKNCACISTHHNFTRDLAY
jgi:hypothetical protein